MKRLLFILLLLFVLLTMFTFWTYEKAFLLQKCPASALKNNIPPTIKIVQFNCQDGEPWA